MDSSAYDIGIATIHCWCDGIRNGVTFVIPEGESVILYFIFPEKLRIARWGEARYEGGMVYYPDNSAHLHGWVCRHEKQGRDASYSSQESKSEYFFHGGGKEIGLFLFIVGDSVG